MEDSAAKVFRKKFRESSKPSKSPTLGDGSVLNLQRGLYLYYILRNLERIIFDMRLAELNTRIKESIDAGKFVEAFSLKSFYVEGVITVIFVAIVAAREGFDGKENKLSSAMERAEKWMSFYRKAINERLDEKIKVLRSSKILKDDKQADYLYTWKDKYRDEIFHNFAELMLHVGEPDAKAKLGLEFMSRFTEQEWFKRLETHFEETEQELISSTIQEQ